MSVKLNECFFNSTVAQNKEHLLKMLKRQSVSAVYNLIQLYTVKLRNMQKYAKYIYIQICKNVAKYVKICKNANLICKFSSFYKTIIGFKGRRFK